MILHIDALSKSYFFNNKEVLALKNVNLNIRRGDIFGLIGQSGAGKSSLIRCLAGLIAPSKGAIFFNGKNIASGSPEAIGSFRKEMGMIFQHFNLLSSRTAEQNIAFPLELAGMDSDEIKQRTQELLNLVGLSHKKDAYPSQMSGGEKQRVGIARALSCNPQILLCDEATSALDPQTTKEILDLLKHLNKTRGITIFLITHEMDVIRSICNKVAVMEKGEIIEQGVVSEVFFQPKHPTTKKFLQNCTHEIPDAFFHSLLPGQKLIRLTFKGSSTGEPIISRLVKSYDVEASILLGWIDNLNSDTIGNLVVSLTGAKEATLKALDYLKENGIICEELTHEP